MEVAGGDGLSAPRLARDDDGLGVFAGDVEGRGQLTKGDGPADEGAALVADARLGGRFVLRGVAGELEEGDAEAQDGADGEVASLDAHAVDEAPVAAVVIFELVDRRAPERGDGGVATAE